MMKLKQAVKNVFRKMGYEIVKYESSLNPIIRKKKLLEAYGIGVVIDVGANVGQFGKQLRSLGYKGKIISFEPQKLAYDELLNSSKNDNLWDSHNCALGSVIGNEEINIAGNSYSSSILQMLPSHEKSAPESVYIGKEQIQVKTLDSIFDTVCSIGQKILLKIDTQGFEEEVINGAKNSLKFIDTIQLEMSLVHFYKGELLFNEMYALLHKKGYQLVSIEQGFSDKKTGQLFQVDGIFHRF